VAVAGVHMLTIRCWLYLLTLHCTPSRCPLHNMDVAILLAVVSWAVWQGPDLASDPVAYCPALILI
jgi:hypothetical protein